MDMPPRLTRSRTRHEADGNSSSVTANLTPNSKAQDQVSVARRQRGHAPFPLAAVQNGDDAFVDHPSDSRPRPRHPSGGTRSAPSRRPATVDRIPPHIGATESSLVPIIPDGGSGFNNPFNPIANQASDVESSQAAQVRLANEEAESRLRAAQSLSGYDYRMRDTSVLQTKGDGPRLIRVPNRAETAQTLTISLHGTNANILNLPSGPAPVPTFRRTFRDREEEDKFSMHVARNEAVLKDMEARERASQREGRRLEWPPQ